MNNNYYYEPFNNYLMTQNSLLGPYEGYLKGNLFSNLYEQYKNYKPATITFSNEKEEALFNLNQISFAMHELNLYLDIHKDDSTMINTYVNYQNTYNNLLRDYQQKYGPVNVDSITNNTPFTWITNNFPWEVK